MLTQLDKFPDKETCPQYTQAHMDVDHMDTTGHNGPAENAGIHTEGATKE